MTGDPPLVVIAAGGTGGHLFPAEALAVVLKRRGLTIDLATDERATQYGADFPARTTHIVPSATFRGRDVISVARTLSRLAAGTLKAYRLLGALKPAAVVGFGGYPTIPTVLAATQRRIATVIHEQNGVIGRANRLLAPRVRAIATGFAGVLANDPKLSGKVTHVGNPVRPAVVKAASIPFAAPVEHGMLRLLVFGGSQGARIMAEIVPPAVERLDPALRSRLMITQQARAEDFERVREIYGRLGVNFDVAPFFPDLPARMAAAHLVVSRSGASTVAELAAIGRPGILVPLPNALDQDQFANAGVLMDAGGAIRLPQVEFTPERLAQELAALAADPPRLAAMAAAAKRSGSVNAAEQLADLVLKTAGLTARASP